MSNLLLFFVQLFFNIFNESTQCACNLVIKKSQLQQSNTFDGYVDNATNALFFIISGFFFSKHHL